LVYRPYIEEFCYTLIRFRFFTSIEDAIIKNDKALLNGKKWEALSIVEKNNALTDSRKEILARHRTELLIKKTAVVLAVPVAIAAGVGFAALAFSQVLQLLLFFGVAGGVATFICPWAIAIPIGIIYGIVMYAMIHKAIENNLFGKIWSDIKSLFAHDNNWEKMSRKEKWQFVIACCVKAIFIFLILSCAIVGNIFTAGTILQKSAIFLHASLGIIQTASNAIAGAILAVTLVTNFGFNLENSVETVKTVSEITWQKTKSFITNPKNLGKTLVNGFAFLVHVIGCGAVAAQGVPGFLGMGSTASSVVGASTGTLGEALCDGHAILEEEEEHDVVGAVWKGVTNLAYCCKNLFWCEQSSSLSLHEEEGNKNHEVRVSQPSFSNDSRRTASQYGNKKITKTYTFGYSGNEEQEIFKETGYSPSSSPSGSKTD
jgi:hypothetical protein